MARPIHPRKEIEEALRYAEEHGWRVEQGGTCVGPNLLPVQRPRVSLRRVLHHQHLEHAQKRVESRKGVAPRGRPMLSPRGLADGIHLHAPIQAG